jgi:hypothetical protein
LSAFWLLGLKREHSWQEPAIGDGKDYLKAISSTFARWVKEHGSKYSMQRYVVEAPK